MNQKMNEKMNGNMNANTTTKKTSWCARAPSNIALIKYMGKTDAARNRPTNSSLSYTLPHLRSIVVLELDLSLRADRWEPLLNDEGRELEPVRLSEKGQARFLSHLVRLKERFGFRGSFVVRSANDFPSDCGLASSASSFAALTMAALDALSDLTGQAAPSVAAAAELSRQGSGSSCRSFFSPWCLWTSEGDVREVSEIKQSGFLHQVIVVADEKKAVSSSEAHARVASSLLFRGRPERAEERARALIAAFQTGDWREAYEISWAEFWDMHALFESSRPSFGYMTDGTLAVLKWVREEIWEKTGDGPLLTMDAGANIHLLYRQDQREAFWTVLKRFESRYRVFSSEASRR